MRFGASSMPLTICACPHARLRCYLLATGALNGPSTFSSCATAPCRLQGPLARRWRPIGRPRPRRCWPSSALLAIVELNGAALPPLRRRLRPRRARLHSLTLFGTWDVASGTMRLPTLVCAATSLPRSRALARPPSPLVPLLPSACRGAHERRKRPIGRIETRLPRPIPAPTDTLAIPRCG